MNINVYPDLEHKRSLLQHIHSVLAMKGAVNMVYHDNAEVPLDNPCFLVVPVNPGISDDPSFNFRIVMGDTRVKLYSSVSDDDNELLLCGVPYCHFMTYKATDTSGSGFESVWAQFPTERFRNVDDWDVFETSLESHFTQYLSNIENLF